jgi:hypothetical protein
VGVDIEGDGDGGVTEQLLYELRMDVLLEKKRGTGVPEVVEGYLRQLRALEERRERPLTEVGGVDEGVTLSREHEALILI